MTSLRGTPRREVGLESPSFSMIAKILAAGAIAGLVVNVTGYLITGMLFHRYQARTPGTWRASESWAHYMVSMAIRIFACIAIGLVYGAIGTDHFGWSADVPLRGASFGVCLWAAVAAPILLELAVFVKWHRGFVIGLLLDWWVVCVLAGVASSIALQMGSR
jgi:hypothetical protein